MASKGLKMAMDYTTGYASIVKYDKNDDGTLMVFGKATDDTLDLDSQICDPTWLDSAMPAWFKSGGNIREMHGPSAAGVAKEYEVKADGHYIGVHVVDPIAVKKVEAKVYQGFSIGIKSPRVVRDTKAANGRIIDGSIIEISLVDRPANPSAKLILAKSVVGESSLVQVEELHEYKAPLPTAIAKMTEKGSKMEKIKQIAELAKSLTPDSVKFDRVMYDAALKSVADLIVLEAGEITAEHSERESIEHLIEALKHLEEWYEGEIAEGEVAGVEPTETLGGIIEEMMGDKSAEADEVKADCPDCTDDKMCDKCAEMTVKADEEKTVEPELVQDVVPLEEEIKEDSEDKTSDAPSLEDVVEAAVKSAMASVRVEIESLRAEKESAVEKSITLETELATALTKSVAGGPKRTALATGSDSNEYLVKASMYKAKAEATTDPLLAKGYRALHAEFSAKGGVKVATPSDDE